MDRLTELHAQNTAVIAAHIMCSQSLLPTA
jgi:hypothetical protein